MVWQGIDYMFGKKFDWIKKYDEQNIFLLWHILQEDIDLALY